MKRAINWGGKLDNLLETYRNQPHLTPKLDRLGSTIFDQEIINEIVLWKVNRYSLLSPNALSMLNSTGNIEPGAHRKARPVLGALLDEPGVDLAMASTFLRFRNPDAFQIVDRHAYRAVYGKKYPLYSKSSADEKIELYFGYLDELIKLARSRKVKFKTLDRVLYLFDKQENGKL